MLDGTYTRHLGMALDVSWTEHMTNTELYGDLVKVSQKIKPIDWDYQTAAPDIQRRWLPTWFCGNHHKVDQIEGENKQRK